MPMHLRVVVTAIWSAILYHNYVVRGVSYYPPATRRLYVLEGVGIAIAAGVIIGGLVNLIMWIFHL